MNREIIFRGKRANNGEWVYGDLRQDTDLEDAFIGGWNYYASETGIEREPFEYEVIVGTVGQYTGLKDKNGKKIFEGDICCDEVSHFTIEWNESECGFVIWSGGNIFGIDQTYGVPEVIGNIHDNPELLEVE